MTWAALMAMGLGEMGLTPKQLYDHTLQEFTWRVKGAKGRKIKEWEQIRFLAFTIAKPHLKNQNISIERFLPLESDNINGIAAIKSPEERREAAMKLKQRILDAAKNSKSNG